MNESNLRKLASFKQFCAKFQNEFFALLPTENSTTYYEHAIQNAFEQFERMAGVIKITNCPTNDILFVSHAKK